jgi:hypothetical protein
MPARPVIVRKIEQCEYVAAGAASEAFLQHSAKFGHFDAAIIVHRQRFTHVAPQPTTIIGDLP